MNHIDKPLLKPSARVLTFSLVLLLLALPFSLIHAETSSQKQAEEIFQKAYKQFTGPEGCSFSYKVNLIGIYKNAGTMWTKGKKQRFIEKRYLGWTNEHIFYKVDQKNKIVEIHKPNSPKRDKYSSKFKFNAEDFNYSVETEGDNYIISMDKKSRGTSTIKHALVTIDRKTYAPVKLRLKVLFFWATIDVADFKKGISDESIFEFPKSKFSDYKFKDERGNE